METAEQVAVEMAESNAEVLVEKLQQQIKPEQAAEMVFRYYWPQYKNLVSGLSNKDARRLNEAVIGYPLEVLNKNFFSKEAKEAFHLAKVLLDAKFILQQSALATKVKELETTSLVEGTIEEVKTVTEGE
jgi:hypothetical protein